MQYLPCDLNGGCEQRLNPTNQLKTLTLKSRNLENMTTSIFTLVFIAVVAALARQSFANNHNA